MVYINTHLHQRYYVRKEYQFFVTNQLVLKQGMVVMRCKVLETKSPFIVLNVVLLDFEVLRFFTCVTTCNRLKTNSRDNRTIYSRNPLKPNTVNELSLLLL